MKTIKIIATIIAKTEHRNSVLNAIQTLVVESRKESGCISYDLHCDITNPNKFVILEHWRSQEDIDIHNQTPHFKALGSKTEGMTEGIDATLVKEII